MAQRLLIAAGLVGAVVLALVLFLGGDATERRDGIVANPVPTTEAPPGEADSTEAAPGGETATDAEELEGQLIDALGEELAREPNTPMAAQPVMRRDAGPVGAMSAMRAGDLADPFLYQTPRERERRAEASRNRNWRSLDLVNGLIIGVTEGIETARAEGNTERVESLEATKVRLEARRDALQTALGDAPRPEPAQ